MQPFLDLSRGGIEMPFSERKNYENEQEGSDWFWQLFPPEHQGDIAIIDLTAQDKENTLLLGNTDKHETLPRPQYP
jgi:hypothetical protein